MRYRVEYESHEYLSHSNECGVADYTPTKNPLSTMQEYDIRKFENRDISRGEIGGSKNGGNTSSLGLETDTRCITLWSKLISKHIMVSKLIHVYTKIHTQ